jgi:hypothetical protein
MEIDVEKYSRSCDLISGNFSSPFRDTYRRGKTRLRDLLYEKLGCSLLEAEAMVDEMERTGRILFSRSERGGLLGTWEIRQG